MPAIDVLEKVATGVTDALTGGTFSQPFTAERSYADWELPLDDADAGDLRVDVGQPPGFRAGSAEINVGQRRGVVLDDRQLVAADGHGLHHGVRPGERVAFPLGVNADVGPLLAEVEQSAAVPAERCAVAIDVDAVRPSRPGGAPARAGPRSGR